MPMITGVILTTFAGFGEDFHHLPVIVPGGIPGMPIMTGVQPVTNGVNVTWYGPSGYYRLYQKLALTGSAWQLVSGLNLTNNATITEIYSNAFFRVSGPAPHYAGWQTCAACHQDTHAGVMETPHAAAFTNTLFKSLGGQTNSSCLPCHTVGYGLPTGFVSEAITPQLAAVECENCHGPAANHAANPDDPTLRPHVEIAATVCGGCHDSKFVPDQVAQYHLPFYEDWNASPHRAVVPDVAEEMQSAQGPTVFIPNCGRCHSGTVREAFLENEPLPDGHEAAAIAISCAICHDPHEEQVHTNVLNGVLTSYTGVTVTNIQLGAVYTNQIRYPFASLQDYHVSGDFSTNYNPNINVCAQCHNDRGASWTSSSRPPHHSPQYNMLLGTVGVLASDLPPDQPATHSLLEKQCVTCHVQMTNDLNGSLLGGSGHTFRVDTYATCRRCHPLPESLVQFTTSIVSNQIQQIKASLDLWATTKAPEQLRTNYGTLSWEYTNPGDLSSGTQGPSAAEQSLIPVNIRKARFDLYVVLYDGSFGVHNAPYSITLLQDAQDWVQEELDK